MVEVAEAVEEVAEAMAAGTKPVEVEALVAEVILPSRLMSPPVHPSHTALVPVVVVEVTEVTLIAETTAAQASEAPFQVVKPEDCQSVLVQAEVHVVAEAMDKKEVQVLAEQVAQPVAESPTQQARLAMRVAEAVVEMVAQVPALVEELVALPIAVQVPHMVEAVPVVEIPTEEAVQQVVF